MASVPPVEADDPFASVRSAPHPTRVRWDSVFRGNVQNAFMIRADVEPLLSTLRPLQVDENEPVTLKEWHDFISSL